MKLTPMKSLVRYRRMERLNSRRVMAEVYRSFHTRVLRRVWTVVGTRLLQQLYDGAVAFKQEGNYP